MCELCHVCILFYVRQPSPFMSEDNQLFPYVRGVRFAKYDFGSVLGSVLQKMRLLVWFCKNQHFSVRFSFFLLSQGQILLTSTIHLLDCEVNELQLQERPNTPIYNANAWKASPTSASRQRVCVSHGGPTSQCTVG